MMKCILKMLRWLKHELVAWRYFRYDRRRMLAYSGAFTADTRGKLLAKLIMRYHVLEKGLTMPARRFWFGWQVVLDVMALADEFAARYGDEEPQCRHAIGVVRAYWELHREHAQAHEQELQVLARFLERFPQVSAAVEPHCRREEFYAAKDAPFPSFCQARHTLRHYAEKELSMDRLRVAVDMARSAPSACNRQHSRVHVVSDRELISTVLTLQGGNRGFGHLANKLLVVTADLEALAGIGERNDVYVNGGMFLMNLCYALYHEEIAHCILNWSKSPAEDKALRKLVGLRDSETVIALLTCGETPEEFDVAASPRKNLEEVLIVE